MIGKATFQVSLHVVFVLQYSLHYPAIDYPNFPLLLVMTIVLEYFVKSVHSIRVFQKSSESYSTIVLYIRDIKGVGAIRDIIKKYNPKTCHDFSSQ